MKVFTTTSTQCSICVVPLDALPGEILQGKVESLSPASGVSYSPNQTAAAKLLIGMSVTPTITIE